MIKSATISPDGKSRYTLARVWDRSKPPLLFIMLNPSTADENTDDATIRKCIGFAQRMQFGSILVVNLFAFRARDPDDLKVAGFPLDYVNNSVIKEAVFETMEYEGSICCAWGTKARWPKVADRARNVLAMLRELGVKPKALRVLHDGIPSHPLMLSYTNTLKDFPC